MVQWLRLCLQCQTLRFDPSPGNCKPHSVAKKISGQWAASISLLPNVSKEKNHHATLELFSVRFLFRNRFLKNTDKG